MRFQTEARCLHEIGIKIKEAKEVSKYAQRKRFALDVEYSQGMPG
jgi:hypothetical protein